MMHHFTQTTLWRHPVRVYAGIVAALTALTIVAYHAQAAYHVTWAVPATVVAWVIVAVFLRSAITAFVVLVAMAPLELAKIATVGSYDVRLFHVALVVCAVVIAGCIVRDGIGTAWAGLRHRWTWADTALVVLGGVSVVTALVADQQSVALSQTVILGICIALYAAARFFVRSAADVVRVVTVVVAGGAVVGVYATMQNIFFHSGMPSAEVMPGRPNALLSEPDWLGVYMVAVYAMALVQLYVFSVRAQCAWWKKWLLYGALVTVVTAIVISAARSAWVGAIAVTGVYGMLLGMRGAWEIMARHIVVGVGVITVVAGAVYFGQLTSFGLLDRMSSTGTGQQEITVSCDDAAQAEHLVRQGFVVHVEDLAQYTCRHIKLEEIVQEENDGNSVIRIKRADPNITLRKEVYTTTLAAIAQRPWMGYGWGASGTLLGTDERQTPLNTSNIFLEVLFSTGAVGAVAYLAFVGVIGIYGIVRWVRRRDSVPSIVAAALAAVLGLCAIVVPNLFNAGMFLAIVWVLCGAYAATTQRLR